MKRLWSNDERRAHGIQRKLLKVITSFPGEDLVDHKSLVASPGRLQLPGGGEPQFGLTVHGESPKRSIRCSTTLSFYGMFKLIGSGVGEESEYKNSCVQMTHYFLNMRLLLFFP